MKQDVLMIAVGVLGGCLVAILGLQWWGGDEAADPGEPVAPAPALDLDHLAAEIAQRLERIQATELLPLPPDQGFEPAAAPAEAERAPVPTASSSGGDLEARLRAVEERMQTLEEAIRDGGWLDPPPDLGLLRTGPRVRDWDALKELAQTYWNDPQAAVDSVLFLDQAEVLGRFGPPTSVTRKNEWYYRITDWSELFVVYVELRFVNGYVSRLHVRRSA
jgi:hypothetical protein